MLDLVLQGRRTKEGQEGKDTKKDMNREEMEVKEIRKSINREEITTGMVI